MRPLRGGARIDDTRASSETTYSSEYMERILDRVRDLLNASRPSLVTSSEPTVTTSATPFRVGDTATGTLGSWANADTVVGVWEVDGQVVGTDAALVTDAGMAVTRPEWVVTATNAAGERVVRVQAPLVQHDVTPDAFSFAPVLGVEPGAVRAAPRVTFAGFTGSLPLAQDAGEMVVRDAANAVVYDGAAQSAPTIMAKAGWSLEVGAAAPAEFGATRAVAVSLGEATATWTLTTRARRTIGFSGSLPDVAARAGEPIAPIDVAALATLSEPGAAVTWSVVQGPSWLSISAAGVLTGTPPEEAAPRSVAVHAATTDGDATIGLTLAVGPPRTSLDLSGYTLSRSFAPGATWDNNVDRPVTSPAMFAATFKDWNPAGGGYIHEEGGEVVGAALYVTSDGQHLVLRVGNAGTASDVRGAVPHASGGTGAAWIVVPAPAPAPYMQLVWGLNEEPWIVANGRRLVGTSHRGLPLSRNRLAGEDTRSYLRPSPQFSPRSMPLNPFSGYTGMPALREYQGVSEAPVAAPPSIITIPGLTVTSTRQSGEWIMPAQRPTEAVGAVLAATFANWNPADGGTLWTAGKGGEAATLYVTSDGRHLVLLIGKAHRGAGPRGVLPTNADGARWTYCAAPPAAASLHLAWELRGTPAIRVDGAEPSSTKQHASQMTGSIRDRTLDQTTQGAVHSVGGGGWLDAAHHDRLPTAAPAHVFAGFSGAKPPLEIYENQRFEQIGPAEAGRVAAPLVRFRNDTELEFRPNPLPTWATGVQVEVNYKGLQDASFWQSRNTPAGAQAGWQVVEAAQSKAILRQWVRLVATDAQGVKHRGELAFLENAARPTGDYAEEMRAVAPLGVGATFDVAPLFRHFDRIEVAPGLALPPGVSVAPDGLVTVAASAPAGVGVVNLHAWNAHGMSWSRPIEVGAEIAPIRAQAVDGAIEVAELRTDAPLVIDLDGDRQRIVTLTPAMLAAGAASATGHAVTVDVVGPGGDVVGTQTLTLGGA